MLKMKYFPFITMLLLSVFLLNSCGNGKKELKPSVSDNHNPASPEGVSKQEERNMPVLTFEKTTHDFGKVVQGERLSYTFKFKNTGKSNLIIYNSNASCGCTTSIPPKEPIRPGESGEIVVAFDSKNKSGKETHSVVVSANTYPVNTLIRITAEVIIP